LLRRLHPAVAAVKTAMIRFIVEFPEPPGEPKPGAIESAKSQADRLLWVLGDLDSIEVSAEWAERVRKDLGEATTARLVQKHQTDLASLRADPHREVSKPDPEIQFYWDAAIAKEAARREAAGLPGAEKEIRRKIEQLDSLPPNERDFGRQFLRYTIKDQKFDPATEADLLALLAQTEPEARGPGEAGE